MQRNRHYYFILMISITLMISMVSCKSNSANNGITVPPSNSSTSEVEIEKTTEKLVYSDFELSRAVTFGIGDYQENAVITHRQFFQMLDNIVERIDAELLPQWKEILPIARESNAEMTRTEGMIEIYYAAAFLGEDYINYNTQWEVIHNKIGDAWDTLLFNDRLYPDIYEPTIIGPEWDNHDAAAYFYSMGRVSAYSGNLIFDYDEEENTMHPDKPFMYEDALLAALRLYDSTISTMAMRVPTDEDEAFLAKVDERREAILNSPTTVTVEGKSYYVSNNGNDNNNGLSPDTAWATLKKVNNANLSAGDGVLFERGGLWRGLLLCQDNVSYSAYGEGQKPRIYGSPENGADPEKWSLLDGTDNIWVFYKDMYDTGGIVFNEGESWAIRMVAFWDGEKYVDIADRSKIIGPELLENNQIFSAVDYTGYSSQEARYELVKKGKLYLRSDEGNPGEIYESIEFLCLEDNQGSENIVVGGHNNVIDNLSVKYTSGSGIVVRSDSTIQNCEVGWIGGTIMNFYEGAECLFRVGDGIVLTRGTDSPGLNNKAINNYVYYTYDIGLSTEIAQWGDETQRYVKDAYFSGNLAENCSAGIGVTDWASLNEPDGWGGQKLYRNVLIEDNYVLYSGYGWSHQTVDYDWGVAGFPINNQNSAIIFGFAENPDGNGRSVIVKENVIYLSRYALVGARVHEPAFRYDVAFVGNTYVQNEGGILTEWVKPDDDTFLFSYPYNQFAPQTIEDVLGDTSAKIFD